jgi:polysaccharide biosynthesis protein PslH
MKILFIATRFPYPALKGDQNILYQRLKKLSKVHKITLIHFYQNKSEILEHEIVAPYCEEIISIQLTKLQILWNIANGFLFSGLPLQVCYYKSTECENAIKKLNINEFDIVHGYLLRVGEYVLRIDKPRILELIDSMQLNLERRIEKEKNSVIKWVLGEELKRIKLYEQKTVKQCDANIVVSSIDKDIINQKNVFTIPLGVDTDMFNRKIDDNKDITIIFSGNMAYPPNIHAVEWFLDNCWSKIKSKELKTIFKIVGVNPPKSLILKYNKDSSVVFTGFVKSLAEELKNAQIAIAPMQSGSGMQFKILEAMAVGLPVVTTTLGLGGIEAINNRDIIVADSSELFVECCVDLLKNLKLRENIGNNASDLIRSKYSWQSNIEKIEALYKKLQ